MQTHRDIHHLEADEVRREIKKILIKNENSLSKILQKRKNTDTMTL